jgi:hypothetical protein
MWLYLDELQFKFEFHSGRMIFGWVMALELVFFVQMFSCSDFFINLLWDIDLLFGLWLYLDELQFKFEFRSGWMIFGWVMALELVCSNFKLSRLFFYILWYIDLIFGMWLYLDELQFKFEFCSGRMIFGWVVALELVFFVQILSCLQFIFMSFEILTWYLVCGYI